jgi:hypothetical protein
MRQAPRRIIDAAACASSAGAADFDFGCHQPGRRSTVDTRHGPSIAHHMVRLNVISMLFDVGAAQGQPFCLIADAQ